MNISLLKEVYGDHYVCYLLSEGVISLKEAKILQKRNILLEKENNQLELPFPGNEPLSTPQVDKDEDVENCKVERIFKLSQPNAKIGHWSFSLRSGWTCPFAQKCFAKVIEDPATGKKSLMRRPDSEFTCFSASQEVMFPAVYNARLHNEELSKKLLKEGGIPRFVEVLNATFEANKEKVHSSGYFRIHVGGDFYSQQYYDAWVAFASANPGLKFYAYTKSAPYVLNNPPPSNLIITNSLGSRNDDMIINNGHKFVAVLWKPDEIRDISSGDTVVNGWQFEHTDGTKSKSFDLPIDHDDSNAYLHDRPFALLIHGMQAAGSLASQAIRDMKTRDVKYSYSTKNKKSKKNKNKKTELAELARHILESERKKNSKYSKFKQAVLAYYGVNSADELEPEKKKKFYKYIDSQWKRFKVSLSDAGDQQ